MHTFSNTHQLTYVQTCICTHNRITQVNVDRSLHIHSHRHPHRLKHAYVNTHTGSYTWLTSSQVSVCGASSLILSQGSHQGLPSLSGQTQFLFSPLFGFCCCQASGTPPQSHVPSPKAQRVLRRTMGIQSALSGLGDLCKHFLTAVPGMASCPRRYWPGLTRS